MRPVHGHPHKFRESTYPRPAPVAFDGGMIGFMSVLRYCCLQSIFWQWGLHLHVCFYFGASSHVCFEMTAVPKYMYKAFLIINAYTWCEFWCVLLDNYQLQNISDNIHNDKVYLWCEFLRENWEHSCLQSISDNAHNDKVSLWCEFWCAGWGDSSVQNISDNAHNDKVFLWCEFWYAEGLHHNYLI